MDAAERALAYAEIRQLAAAYAFFTDAKDIDALVELYVPDVRISSALSGRDQLHQLMTDALRTVGVTFLNIGTHHIVLADDGESATGVVYSKAEIQGGGPDSERWINYAIQPQVMPRMIGLSVYRLDINFRESAVVGIVGGGGIGATLNTAFDRYEFDTAAAILLVIIGIVLVLEYISGYLRKWVQ